MIEGNIGSFDIIESPLTNEEVIVTYTPSSIVKSYTYEITKDGKSYDVVKVNAMKSSKITLYETGTYQITVTATDKYNREIFLQSGIYSLDLDAPSIICNKNSFEIYQNSDVNKLKDEIKTHLIVKDNISTNIENNIEISVEGLDVSLLGIQNITYSVSDEAGNLTTKNLQIRVIEDNRTTLLIFQVGLFIFLVGAILWYLRYKRSVQIEKRLSKYSVEAVYDRRISMLDSLMKQYTYMIDQVSKILKKSFFLKKQAKRYEKYVPLYKDMYQDGMDFIAVKCIVSLLFVVIAILSKTLQSEVMNIYEVILPLLVGFFAPDIVYISKYKLYRNRLENDFLQAIIIMNNAFKSGRSIEQAIGLVTKELDGPISEEFKKMHLEVSFGLSIDVVFKRFAERIKLEEVSYLTASLSILNKTGGNIIKVFTSIEKTLFNKKKLRLELASLTSGSKIIVYMLAVIPILFVISISLISPTYFEGFYTTDIGLILMGIIITIYVAYIFCVMKIMKVRM